MSTRILRWIGDNNLPFDVFMGVGTAAAMLGVALGVIALFLLWVISRRGRK